MADKAAPPNTPDPGVQDAEVVEPDPQAAPPKTAEPPKEPQRQPTNAEERTTYRFTGPYRATYLLPGRVQDWVNPGQVIDWDADGPQDQHWQPADPPKQAPNDDDEQERG